MIANLPELKDDSLITPEVGAWAEDKYRLVGNYAAMFATSMKKKWECRIYIDKDCIRSGAKRNSGYNLYRWPMKKSNSDA
jgi:hypothetical protein